MDEEVLYAFAQRWAKAYKTSFFIQLQDFIKVRDEKEIWNNSLFCLNGELIWLYFHKGEKKTIGKYDSDYQID